MSMNLQEPLQQNQKHNPQHSSFPLWAQFSCVFLYFGFDLILRFCYQAVLDGNNLLLQLSATRTDKADESYSTIQDASSYNKPAFLVLCCYTTFILWGPLVVFPYLLYFYRPRRGGGGGHDNNAISSSTAAAVIFQYYTQEWSGALSFSRAFLYTCCMGMILFLGNLGYVSGLRYISVALGSALSQGEAPLTVFLSVVVLGRYFGRWEKRGIVLSLLGIALIAIPPVLWTSRRENDDDDDDDFDNNVSTGTTSTWEQQLGGVISTFLGAFGFGAYQVFWPYFDEKRYSTTSTATTASKSHNHHPVAPTTPIHAIMDTLATLTLVGFFLLSTGWILILFLHITGLEPFEIPPKEIRATLMISSILSALTDALNGIACVVASTVVVALAYPLIIPLSVLLQWWVDGISPSKWGALGWIGTVSVVAGVFCLESSGGGDGGGGAGDCIGSRDHDDDDGTTARTSLQEEGSKVQFVEMGRMIKIMSKKEEEKEEEEEKETAQPTPRAITELV